MRDGKGQFYKNLRLDKKTRQVITFFRKVKRELAKELSKKRMR
jgi:hypothetical protein